jgi:hypothetical protein
MPIFFLKWQINNQSWRLRGKSEGKWETVHTGLKKPSRRGCYGGRWFSACDQYAESWYGPHNRFEYALEEAACSDEFSGVVFVCQGRKLLKSEQDEIGAEYDWEVEYEKFEVCLRWRVKCLR